MARCTCTRAVRWSAAIWGVALLFLSAWKVLLKDTSPNSIHDSHAHVFNVLPPRLSHTNTGDLERRECNPQLLSYPWTVLELESYYERQLIFFAKPIMQAVKTISLENRWKVKLILNDSSTNVARLESLLSPRKFTILFTSSKILGRPEVHKYMNYSNMLIAAVPNMYRVSGAKKDQYLAFEALLNRHGCSMKSVAIMPRTFLLDDYEQCSAFFHYVTEVNNPLALWVIKTSQGYGGDGVKMFNNVSQLVDQFGSCPNRREYIAQEHVGNMLLVEGRKFDVRALILVAGTRPVMVFYHDGYLRVSIREYDSQATGREVHLTNSHVQITSKGFNPENHFWSHKRFQDYLDKYHSDNGKFVEAVLIPFIQKIGTFVVNSGTLHCRQLFNCIFYCLCFKVFKSSYVFINCVLSWILSRLQVI